MAVNTVELLSCDEDALFGFLFVEEVPEDNRNSSEISEKIDHESDSIITDAELLFNDESQD